MSRSFTHSADSLHSFFSQPGRGFYIPYYQRNYSWDEDNATKLVFDIFSGIKRTLTKPNNSIFLGTIILHDEKDVGVGVHTDTPNLLTKVSNVVDGQQRITSLAMLACVFSHCIENLVEQLKTVSVHEFQQLADELVNEQPEIREFFSVEIRKTGTSPRLKPLIIRAGDVTSNPVSDQWTLSGDKDNFYRSNTSGFISDFIVVNTLSNSLRSDQRIDSIIDAFKGCIDNEINSADGDLTRGLLTANTVTDGSLYNFIAYPPDLSNIQELPNEQQKIFFGGILLLAACKFLRNSCHLVVIECLDLGLAFDMFQSLNATGTPLTAFEVFKPAIVNLWGQQNYSTTIKPVVDRIERVFEEESTASGKEELTDKVIVSSALVYNGEVISKRFSDERDWLINNLPKVVDASAIDFVTCIADQAEYCLHFIRPRRSQRNSTSFGMVKHLQQLGLSDQQADMSALCIFYLRDAGHQFAHSVLSVFYAKLLRAQGNLAAVTLATEEFSSVCQATAAFFTLWMGALLGRFPDAEYRRIFQSKGGNISVISGAANQTDAFIKSAFRSALEVQSIYRSNDAVASRQLWVSQAKENPWYSRKAVCRFALLVASHDAAPNLTAGQEGFFTDGMPSSADLLNCRIWHSSEYEVIEHVATRDRPSTIKFPAYSDASIYPGNYSVVDKIGNLTLLSVPINSSIYSEWPDKVFYYWSLTTPNNTVVGPQGSELMAALGITYLPPSLASLTASSNYFSHLAPLAYRGTKGYKWDAEFIEKRSEHLCQRIFDKLDSWLR